MRSGEADCLPFFVFSPDFDPNLGRDGACLNLRGGTQSLTHGRLKGAHMQKAFETNRLYLRPLHKSDAARVAYLAGDYDVAKMTGTIPHPYSVKSALDWVSKRTNPPDGEVIHSFAVTRQLDGVIGCCGVTKRELDGQTTWELGYWIGKPYWGQGYATEAAIGVMDWARDNLSAEVFTAGHYSDNSPSGSILRKLGFEHTGSDQAFGIARQCISQCERYIWPEGTKLDNVDPHSAH